MNDYGQAIGLVITLAESYKTLSTEEKALADTLLSNYGMDVFVTFLTARVRGHETDEERIYAQLGTSKEAVDAKLKDELNAPKFE